MKVGASTAPTAAVAASTVADGGAAPGGTVGYGGR